MKTLIRISAILLLLVLCSCHANSTTSDIAGANSNNDYSPNPEQPINSEDTFNKAINSLENGNLEDAYTAFSTIKDYKSTKEYLSRFVWLPKTKTYSEAVEYTDTSNYLYDDLETSTFLYDDLGNVLRETIVEKNGDTEIIFYTYSDNKLHTRIECDEYGYSDVLMYEYINTSDNTLTVLEISNETNIDGEPYVTKYYYENDLLLYIEDGYNRTEYNYDNGKLISTTDKKQQNNSYNTEGIKVDYIYNSADELIKTVSSDNEIFEYTYDDVGRLIKINYYYGSYIYEETFSDYVLFYINEEESTDTESLYHSALEDLDNKEFEKAYKKFYNLNGYKDSSEYLTKFKICPSIITNGGYQERYTYDQNGNIRECKCYSTGGYVETEYIYNENNVLSEIKYKEYDIQYTYDDNGRVSKYTQTWHDGTNRDGWIYTYECEYTTDGKLEKEVCYFEDKLIDTITYSYDSFGKLISKNSIKGNGETSSFLYIYTPDGLLEKEVEVGVTDKYSTTYYAGYNYFYDER